MNDEKQIDAVQMVREIRDRMAERYRKDPNAQRRELEAVRKKYGFPEPAVAQGVAKAGKIADSDSSSG